MENPEVKPSDLCEEFAKVLDCEASVFNGVCLVSRLRSNIHPTVMGRRAESAMFLPQIYSYENIDDEGKALCFGETMILEEEINPFMRRLQDHGIIVTAVHNHWLFDAPRLMYMHFECIDDPILFAMKVKDATKALITEPVYGESNKFPEFPLVTNDNYEVKGLCKDFNDILNGVMHFSEMGKCTVMKMRNNIHSRILGRKANSFLMNTEMYAYESMTADGKALCSGEIVLLQSEVNPFLKKLEKHGVIITGVHNHWLFDTPRHLYMHFALIDYPISFAEKVRDALSVLTTKEVVGK